MNMNESAKYAFALGILLIRDGKRKVWEEEVTLARSVLDRTCLFCTWDAYMHAYVCVCACGAGGGSLSLF